MLWVFGGGDVLRVYGNKEVTAFPNIIFFLEGRRV